MDSLIFIRDLFLRANAETAMFTAFVQRRYNESDARVTLRGLRKLVIVWLLITTFALALSLTSSVLAQWFSVLALILSTIPLGLFIITGGLLPAGISALLRIAKAVPDLGVTDDFFEKLSGPLPTVSGLINFFKKVFLFELILALFSLLVPIGNNPDLIPIFLVATLALVVVISIDGKGYGLIKKVVGAVVVIIILLWVAPNARDAFFNRSYKELVSPARERVENEQLKDGLKKAIEVGDSTSLKSAFEHAPLDSDEEGDAYNKLLLLCRGDLDCIERTKMYASGVISEKSPYSTSSDSSTVHAPVSTRDIVSSMEANSLSWEIQSADIERLIIIYGVYAPRGELDTQIQQRMFELGADADDYRRASEIRDGCKFAKKLPGGRIEQVSLTHEWSEPIGVSAKDYASCIEGTGTFFDYRLDFEEVHLDGSWRDQYSTRHANVIQFRLSQKDPSPDGQKKVWVKSLPMK